MKEDAERVYVSVADSGLGIAKADLTRIFDKFYRVESEKVKKIGGTGIGLPIVKYILELHNGGIDVKSEEGKGTSFTLVIPPGNTMKPTREWFYPSPWLTEARDNGRGDSSLPENKAISEKYQIYGSTLLLVQIKNGVEKSEDLTNFAFGKIHKEDIFISELKEKIEQLLK